MVSRSYPRFDWKRYIDYANELVDFAEKDDAKARCGISRAYYGAFHLVTIALGEDNIRCDPNRGGSHQIVIDQCKEYKQGDNNRVISNWHNIGNLLSRMKDMRILADYKADYFASQKTGYTNMEYELRKALGYAEQILNSLDQIHSFTEIP